MNVNYRAFRRRDCGRYFFLAAMAACALCVESPAYASEPVRPTPQGHYIFRSYGPADGLTNTTVTQLLQDIDGFIWAGTDKGLYRYDGSRFEVFYAKQGLVPGRITALHEDARGVLWVGTVGGLSRWNGVSFVEVPDVFDPKDRVRAIADDASGLWLAATRGLLRSSFDGQFQAAPGWPGGEATALSVGRRLPGVWAARWDGHAHVQRLLGNVWTEYGFANDAVQDRIDALAEDREGRLWARSAFSLWMFDERRQRFELVEPPSPILSDPGYLTLGRAGDLWVSSNERLLHHAGDHWTESLGGAALGTRAVLDDREGSLWFGASGLQRMAGRGVFHAYDGAEGLPGNVAWSVARGADNKLWVGTDHGLARAVGERFETIAGTEDIVVRTIVVAPDGKLYAAGVPGNVVLTIEPERRTVRRIALGTQGAKHIYRLLLDAQGMLWATTSNAGLLRADTRDEALRFVREPLPGSGEQELLRGIDVEANGRLWVAGEAGLLLRENGRWRRFGVHDGLRDNELECIRIMHNGDLLVAYAGTNGFDRIRYEAGQLRILNHEYLGSTSYVDSIFTVGEDAQDNLWIGTGRGIDRYTAGGIEHFGTQQGLVGEDAASMAFLAEPDGDVWIGVVGGLARFDAMKYRVLPARPSVPAKLLEVRLGSQRFAPEALDARVAHSANAFHVRFASPSYLSEGELQYRTLLNGLETNANETQGREAHYFSLPPGRYRFEVAARIGTSGAWGAPTTFAFEVLPVWWQTWWARTLLVLTAAGLLVCMARWRMSALQRRNNLLEMGIAARTAELTRANVLLVEEIGERVKAEEGVQQRNVELEQLNQRLAGTQSQLLQSEKMASVGQLAAGVAHEINNPIGFVQSNLSSLAQYVEDIFELLRIYEQLEPFVPSERPELAQLRMFRQHIDLNFLRRDTDELLTETLDGVTRVKKIVKDLKDFSHVDDAEWQRVDLHQSLDSTLNVVAHELKYKAELIKQYGTLPPIYCLPFQTNQVFLNLLVNAMQAIEGQGGRIVVSTGSDAGWVWVSIADNGKGIEPGILHRIFEPFFTTKPVGIGTGLGLSVSYGIVQTHGGSIDVESVVGSGTTFTVRLPINSKLQPTNEANDPVREIELDGVD